MANEYILKQWTGGAIPTALVGAVSGAATALTCVDLTTFPSSATAPFVIVVDLGQPAEEKMLCTRVANVITAQRGYDSTAAQPHPIGASVHHCIDAYTIEQMNRLANALTVRGDLFRRGAADVERVALGATGMVLTSNGTDAVWAVVPPIGLLEVTTAMLADLSVTTAKLANLAVTTAKINNSAVDATKLQGSKWRRSSATLQTVPDGSTDVQLLLDTQDYNNLGWTYSTPSLIVDTTGMYAIAAETEWNASAVLHDSYILSVTVNGARSFLTYSCRQAEAVLRVGGNLWLRAGDILNVRVSNQNLAPQNVHGVIAIVGLQ